VSTALLYHAAVAARIIRHQVKVGDRTTSALVAPACEAAPHTLVFLHAWPFRAEMWQTQLDARPRGWQAIAPDFRGFGQSTPDATPDGIRRRDDVTLMDYVDDVLALLDAQAVERAVFCGLSMGGYAALQLVRGHPHRVAGLVLADTRATADGEQAIAGRLAMLDVLDSRGVIGVISEMLPKLLSDRTRREKPAFPLFTARLMSGSTQSGVGHAVVRMMRRDTSAAHLPQITCPTLVVVGADDVLTPVAESEAMAGAIPGAELLVIPGAGHMSNLEEPDRFNGALRSFLTRHWGT